MIRNRSARNAFLESKSWKADNGHKGFWKKYVSRARRRGGKQFIANAIKEYDDDQLAEDEAQLAEDEAQRREDEEAYAQFMVDEAQRREDEEFWEEFEKYDLYDRKDELVFADPFDDWYDDYWYD